MKNHGNNILAQNFREMVQDEVEQKQGNKLYKAQSAAFVDDRLSALISKTAEELCEVATKAPVSLIDTETVKERTILYLRACEATASFPSVSGLARSMGLSRQAIYDCIWRQTPPATAAWLEMCRDSFSDILAESALRNNCNPITAIFLQKAVYGLRESVEIVAKTENPLGPITDQKTLEEHLQSLPDG